MLALLAVVLFTIGVVVRWIRRNGLRPTATRGWITIAMVLSVYDLVLNVLGHRRYSSIWWASLGIRAATFAVLLGGLLVHTAIQLQRLERYATTELDRAEGEVNSWAEVTERLLAATSALSAAVTADDVAELLTAAGANSIEVDYAAIYLLQAEGPQRFRLIGGLRSAADAAPVDEPGHPVHRRAAHRRHRSFSRTPRRSRGPTPHRPAPWAAGSSALPRFPSSPVKPRWVRWCSPAPGRESSAASNANCSARWPGSAPRRSTGRCSTKSSPRWRPPCSQRCCRRAFPRRDDVDLVGRYLPATKGVDVGGDWYDVLELGGSKLLLVVGDVMGKGVPAATLMGQMRSAVRTLAAVDPDPAAILSGLDQLAMGFAPDDIVTLVIVSLDVDTGAAVIANAGHLSPLVFAPGAPGEQATPEIRTSPPIGVPVSGPRASSQLRLAAGSGLLLLTDGLVEERDNDLDAALEMLTSRASELLDDPAADLETVADALVQPRVHRDDDVTVLLARLPSGPVAHQAGSGHQVPAAACSSTTTPAGWRRPAGWCARPSVATANSTPSCIDAILLVTSELVTNGLRHGEPPVLLTVDRIGPRLRLTVTDGGSKIPRPRMASPESTGGRGLFLVSVLSTAWKIEPHGNERLGAGQGTSVWAEFAL